MVIKFHETWSNYQKESTLKTRVLSIQKAENNGQGTAVWWKVNVLSLSFDLPTTQTQQKIKLQTVYLFFWHAEHSFLIAAQGAVIIILQQAGGPGVSANIF